jgi:hypothetical protein
VVEKFPNTLSPGKVVWLLPLLLPPALPADTPPALAAPAGQAAAAAPGKLFRPPPETDEPLPETARVELATLAARQKNLLAQAAAATSTAATDDLRPAFQSLCDDYERLIRKHPRNAALLVAFAQLLNSPALDERHRAAGLLARADALDPAIPLVKNQLGNYLAEEGDPAAAVRFYLDAIALAPGEPLYHLQLALLISAARDDLLKTGAWSRRNLDETFLNAHERAAALRPDDPAIAYRRALAFYDVEHPDWDKALALWRALETRLEKTSRQHQIVRRHIAKVLLNRAAPGDAPAARETLSSITAPELAPKKQELLQTCPTK